MIFGTRPAWIVPAALFALLYPLGMPGYDVPGLPFLGLVPLLYLAAGAGDPREAAMRGFLAGTAANLLLYYWIAWTVAVPGELGWIAGGLASLVVSAFVGCFVAAACYATSGALLRFGERGAWVFPFFWTAAEVGRIYLFSGFPWMLLGYSLAGSATLRQAGDLAGILGLGFAVALVNTAAYRASVRAAAREWRKAAVPAGAAALVLLFLAGYGTFRLREATRFHRAAATRVSIAQGGIDQNRKWDPAYQEETLAIYGALTRQARAEGAQVVVWPETAAPFFYAWEPELSAKVDGIAREAGVPLIFGAPWFSPEEGGRYFNSVFHMDERGFPVGRYDKRHLVPFGEYVPMRRLLPFVSKLTAGAEDFSSGESPSLFFVGGNGVGASVCYEAVFPAIGRDSVLAGAKWLVNVTNDAWFGDTVAPWQHLAMARMRSVEFRRPMVRAANAGVSAIVDAQGGIVKDLGLSRRGTVTADVVPREDLTPYAKTGEIFGFSCTIISLFIFLYTLRGTDGIRISGRADRRSGSALSGAPGLSLK